jgi:hypothetical protein
MSSGILPFYGEFLMKNLFEPAALDQLEDRLKQLTPESERQWGKMNAPRMLAHCAIWMEMASGQTFPPRNWIGYIFGPLAKRSVLNDEPIRRNMPSDKNFIVSEERDFASERERLKASIERFATGGPEKCTKHPHSFFGPMTPYEWATLAYKHLDHHFRQFGV